MKSNILRFTFIFSAALLPFISLVAGDGSGKITNPLSSTEELIPFLNTIIDAGLKLGAVVAVVALIYAGFLFVTAAGDEGKIKTAKATILYTVIGIAILLGAKAISTVITNTVTAVGQ
jgi:hypothetical protein